METSNKIIEIEIDANCTFPEDDLVGRIKEICGALAEYQVRIHVINAR